MIFSTLLSYGVSGVLSYHLDPHFNMFINCNYDPPGNFVGVRNYLVASLAPRLSSGHYVLNALSSSKLILSTVHATLLSLAYFFLSVRRETLLKFTFLLNRIQCHMNLIYYNFQSPVRSKLPADDEG